MKMPHLDLLCVVVSSSQLTLQSSHAVSSPCTPPPHPAHGCAVGGARHPDIVHASEEKLVAMALAALRSHVGITREPDAVLAGTHVQCIPQYVVGHCAAVADIRQDVAAAFGSRLILAGNSFDGVGASDCIVSARSAADQVQRRSQTTFPHEGALMLGFTPAVPSYASACVRCCDC